jgi:hypothetical protein
MLNTIEKVKERYNDLAELKSTNVIIYQRESLSDEGKIVLGLISDKVDDYNTWINPEGMDNPIESVVVDFRHAGINIGCRLVDKRNEIINGVKTLIVDMYVPKDSKLWFENKRGEIIDGGSTYDAIKNGRIQFASIQFNPKPYPEYTRTDKNGRIYYGKYRISYVSLLDKAPSQDAAYILEKSNFRNSNNSNNSNIMQYSTNNLVKFNDKLATITGIEGDQYMLSMVDDKSTATASETDLSMPTVEEFQSYIAMGVQEETQEEPSADNTTQETERTVEPTPKPQDNSELISKLEKLIEVLTMKMGKESTKEQKPKEEMTQRSAIKSTFIPVESVKNSNIESATHLKSSDLSKSEKTLEQKLKANYLNNLYK